MISRKEFRKLQKKGFVQSNKKLLASTMLLGSLSTALTSPVIALADNTLETLESFYIEDIQKESNDFTNLESVSNESKSNTTESPNVEVETSNDIQTFSSTVQEIEKMAKVRTSTTDFLAQAVEYAREVASANDLYASVMIAQAILESDWGRSALATAPNHNLFGIKGSYNGASVTFPTQEYLNGQWITINAQFRKYPSFKQSFEDNARVLKTTSFSTGNYYYSGAWKSNTSSYREATQWLTGRYATAPSYASSLNNIIETYGLTAYDTTSTNSGGGSSSVTPTPTPKATQNTYYTVKSGDSVWLIANKFGTTIENIISWNNIKNNLIHPNQQLIVKKGTDVSGSVTPTSTPTPVPTPTPKATQNTYYTVKSGDSVWLIANKFGTTIENIISWNNIKNNLIHPNQQLIVKKGTAFTNNGNASTGNNTSGTSETVYKVVSGDSLWAISQKFNTSINNLKTWNNLKTDIIYINQKLIIKK